MMWWLLGGIAALIIAFLFTKAGRAIMQGLVKVLDDIVDIFD